MVGWSKEGNAVGLVDKIASPNQKERTALGSVVVVVMVE